MEYWVSRVSTVSIITPFIHHQLSTNIFFSLLSMKYDVKIQKAAIWRFLSYILNRGLSVSERNKYHFFRFVSRSDITKRSGSRFHDFFVKTTKESSQSFRNHSIVRSNEESTKNTTSSNCIKHKRSQEVQAGNWGRREYSLKCSKKRHLHLCRSQTKKNKLESIPCNIMLCTFLEHRIQMFIRHTELSAIQLNHLSGIGYVPYLPSTNTTHFYSWFKTLQADADDPK